MVEAGDARGAGQYIVKLLVHLPLHLSYMVTFRSFDMVQTHVHRESGVVGMNAVDVPIHLYAVNET